MFAFGTFPITLHAFGYILLHEKCRLYSAKGVKDIELNFNVNLIDG
jgi:hypothetical protein